MSAVEHVLHILRMPVDIGTAYAPITHFEFAVLLIMIVLTGFFSLMGVRKWVS